MGGWDGANWDDFSSWMCPFRLGIWTGPFPIGDMDWPLSNLGYGPAPFPHLVSPSLPGLMHFRATRLIYVYFETAH